MSVGKKKKKRKCHFSPSHGFLDMYGGPWWFGDWSKVMLTMLTVFWKSRHSFVMGIWGGYLSYRTDLSFQTHYLVCGRRVGNSHQLPWSISAKWVFFYHDFYHLLDEFGPKSKEIDWKPGAFWGVYYSPQKKHYFCFTLCRPFANGGEHICRKIRACRLCTPKTLCLAQA